MGVKGQNPKAQPSTFKIEALRFFWKIDIFRENPKKLKIRYLEIRCSSEKGPTDQFFFIGLKTNHKLKLKPHDYG